MAESKFAPARLDSFGLGLQHLSLRDSHTSHWVLGQLTRFILTWAWRDSEVEAFATPYLHICPASDSVRGPDAL